jgi:adenylyltransferase/sulfurtransferase
VDLSNLPRQTLFSPTDEGQHKVDVAARELREGAPWGQVTALSKALTLSNAREFVLSHDLVIDGTDNFRSKFLLHDACFAARRPFVTAAVHHWEARILGLTFEDADAPCWRCLYPEAPPDGCVATCETAGVPGFVTAIAGAQQALLASRILLGADRPADGTLVLFDGATLESRPLRWRRHADCPLCRQAPSWDRVEAAIAEEELPWERIPRAAREVIVDLREPRERVPGDLDALLDAGSLLLEAPFSLWDRQAPEFQSGKSYLLVCSHGVRSRTALARCTGLPGARFLSLEGGLAAMGRSRGVPGAPAGDPPF